MLVLKVVLCSIHYQRIHPEYWRDRLLRVKAMGLNAIQVRPQLNRQDSSGEPGRLLPTSTLSQSQLNLAACSGM